jgi:hypothetical protein
VVSSRHRVARFLYLLFDDGPRPSEYGTCCGLGWFVLAIPAHVVSVAHVGMCWCCNGGIGDGAALAAAGSSWLAWVGGG